MKLLSFGGSNLAAFVRHFCLQPSSVTFSGFRSSASEMQKVLLEVAHLYYKALVVIHHLFISFIVQDVPQIGPDSCLL